MALKLTYVTFIYFMAIYGGMQLSQPMGLLVACFYAVEMIGYFMGPNYDE